MERYGYYNLSTMSSMKAVLGVLYPELKFTVNRDLKENFQRAIKALAIKSVEDVQNFDAKLEKLTNDRIFFAKTYDLKLIIYVNKDYLNDHKDQLLSLLNPIFYKELDNLSSERKKKKERIFHINRFLNNFLHTTAYNAINIKPIIIHEHVYKSVAVSYFNMVSERFRGLSTNFCLMGDENPSLSEHINNRFYLKKSNVIVDEFFEKSLKNKVDFYEVAYILIRNTKNSIRGEEKKRLLSLKIEEINITANEIRELTNSSVDTNYDAVAKLMNNLYESQYKVEDSAA